jgi:hypothetical protein
MYRATVLMALGLAACALVASAAEHADAHHPPVPAVTSTLAAPGACATTQPSPQHPARRPLTLRLVDCHDRAARYEILGVVTGANPSHCLSIPGAELAFSQSPTPHHPASIVCVTLLDVQGRGPQE